MDVKWTLFPGCISGRANEGVLPAAARSVIACFDRHYDQISSVNHQLKVDAVLDVLRHDLTSFGFSVRSGRGRSEQIMLPVRAGLSRKALDEFPVDAFSKEGRAALMVSAGRGVLNNDFLKHLLVASMLSDVRCACIAVRQVYSSPREYDKARDFLSTLYSSGSVDLALESVILIGY